MKKLVTLAFVLALGVAAVATTGCSSETTAKTGVTSTTTVKQTGTTPSKM